MQAPDHWQHDADAGGAPLSSTLLSPVSWLYRAGARLRGMVTFPLQAEAPVICVGNLTVGGTGKTPVTMALAERLKAVGRDVHIVSRGYGGREKGPTAVDPGRHRFEEVGDEPLLLARAAPTWVAKNKPAGVKRAIRAGADVVLLDDGFQNPSVHKTLSLCLIDAGFGLGNGRVLPSGPLRERAEKGLARADAVVMVHTPGETPRDLGPLLSRHDGQLPILHVRLQPQEAPANTAVYAFAGIGRPNKFFNTLLDAGVSLSGTYAFPDHHVFTEAELKELREAARRHNAVLMTTEKDALRLPAEMRRMVKTWPIRAVFDDTAALDALIASALTPAKFEPEAP